MKKTNIQTAFLNHEQWNQKWNTGFISNVSRLVVFSRKRERVEKAAARYPHGGVSRWSPDRGDSAPGWRAVSVLEVFCIDCSKLHHKPPWRGTFSLLHLMKVGKANWHDDWARWDVKSPASFRNLHPHPAAPGSSSEHRAVCMRYGANAWWWADGAAVSASVLIALIARRVYFFCKKRKQALRMCVCPSFLSSIMLFFVFFIRGFSDYIHTDGSRCFHQT